MSNDRFQILQDPDPNAARSAADGGILPPGEMPTPAPRPEEVIADKIRMSRSDPGKLGKTIFLIGAGCSLTAGIPAVPGVAQRMAIEVARRLCGLANATAEECYQELLAKRKITDCGTPVD